MMPDLILYPVVCQLLSCNNVDICLHSLFVDFTRILGVNILITCLQEDNMCHTMATGAFS